VRRRRTLLLGMTSLAGIAAATLAISPLLVGAGGRVNGPSLGFLNQAEPGAFDHNLAHWASPPAAKRAAMAELRSCDQPAWRADNPTSCPEDGATQKEVTALQASALSASAAAPPAALTDAAANGLWGPLRQIPSTAIHGVLMPTGKVLYFSQPKYPQETEADGGTAHVWDPATGATRAVPPPVVHYDGRRDPLPDAPANLWCAGQTLLPDGRVLVVGGNL
jgi:hypothetical protein